jgi:hypothetical protein
VASIAAHEFVFFKIDDLVIFNSKCACHRHLGQGRPEQIRSVAGFTAIFISFVKLSVFFIYPAIIIYIVQTVGTAGGQNKLPGAWQTVHSMMVPAYPCSCTAATLSFALAAALGQMAWGLPWHASHASPPCPLLLRNRVLSSQIVKSEQNGIGIAT